MPDSLAAVVLGAGHGTRLRPLTHRGPKVLCPVADRPLLDWALERASALVGSGADRIAVNAHRWPEQVAACVHGRAHVSVEVGQPLGTAGALVRLRTWLDGRAVLVLNGDTWSTADLAPAVAGWDGERVLLVVDRPLPGSRVVASLHPPEAIAALPEGVSALDEVCWWPRQAQGLVDAVVVPGTTIACDRPRDYLEANLVASGGRPVVGTGARVAGELVRSVVWAGAEVRAGERLVDAIRLDDGRTVLVR